MENWDMKQLKHFLGLTLHNFHFHKFPPKVMTVGLVQQVSTKFHYASTMTGVHELLTQPFIENG